MKNQKKQAATVAKKAVAKTKKCSVCGKVKPLSEFAPRPDSADGHRGYCRDCGNAKARMRTAKQAATKHSAHLVKTAKQSLNKEIAKHKANEKAKAQATNKSKCTAFDFVHLYQRIVTNVIDAITASFGLSDIKATIRIDRIAPEKK